MDFLKGLHPKSNFLAINWHQAETICMQQKRESSAKARTFTLISGSRHSYLNDVAYAVISDLVKRGELEMDAAEKAHIHAVLCQLAKERLINYSRISHGT